jgi:hypothetical protein
MQAARMESADKPHCAERSAARESWTIAVRLRLTDFVNHWRF